MKRIILIALVICQYTGFSQNVGIGTNNPLSKLHVAGTIRSDTLIYVGPGVRTLFATPNGRIYDSLVAPAALNWEINGNSNITAAHFLGTTTASDLIFKTFNAERMRILASNGSVGIGTNNPLDRVHAESNVNGDMGIRAWNTNNTGASAREIIYVGQAGGGKYGYFSHHNDGYNNPLYPNLIPNSTAVIGGGRLLLGAGTTGDDILMGVNTMNVIYVTVKGNTGNVGIGSMTPGNRLEVTAAAANASGLRFTNLTSASPTVAANGKALSVDANGDVVLMPSASDAWRLLGNAGTTAGTNFLGTTDAQDLVFKTNNAEQGRFLASNGFLGLGTPTPGSRLEVSAIGGDGITIKATTGTDAGDLMFFDATGAEKGRVYTNPLAASGLILSGGTIPAAHVFINNAGNVGIGNSTPNNRLEITSAAANTSGLRFTNLTSASPTVATNGKALSVDINGDVVLMPSASDAWNLLGNAGTTAGTNFLGTTDAQDLVFKTNNTEKMRVTTGGQVGIGTAAPAASAQLEMASTTAGFAMPRMTSAQRKAIVAPIAGLQVYDTNLKGFYVYDGAKWDCANNPAGTVQYFANTVAPNGYLECNGQAVNRIAYAELFSAIGTTYGIGDGVTTFNVPDLRGEFVRGADNGRGADPGRVLGTGQSPSPVVHDDTPGVASQNGDFSMDNVAATYSDPWPGTLAGGIPNAYWSAAPAGGWTVYSGTTTGGAAYGMIHAARPRNVALMPCIKF